MTDSYGTFDPVKTEDYAAPLLESYKDINAGMDNYWGQELQNYKYKAQDAGIKDIEALSCLLYTSPSPRDLSTSRMPSSA